MNSSAIDYLKPVVTVLMPVYNAGMFLEEAIQSILNQTFENYEFLIIDDGSTDESAKIVRSFKDHRIRFLQNGKNIGLTETLNKGLKFASCEFIARMDADDISYPQRLEKQYFFFQQNPDFVLLSNGVRYLYPGNNRVRKIYFNNDHIYYNLIFTCWINTPVTMYKKSVIVNEGGYLTKYAEDLNLWWRISRKYKFFHDNEILLDYRLTNTSLWQQTKKNEYDFAEYEQVARNIQYYAAEKIKFTYDEIAFFRKDPGELIKVNGFAFIKACFHKLDLFNKMVFQKEKEKNYFVHVIGAAYEKKRETLKRVRKHVSTARFFKLLIQLGYWNLFKEEITRTITNKIKLF